MTPFPFPFLLWNHITGQTLNIARLDECFLEARFSPQPNVGLLKAMCAQLSSCRKQLNPHVSFVSVASEFCLFYKKLISFQ